MLIPCKEKYLHKNLFHGAPIAIPRILLYSRSPVHPVLWQSRILQFPAPLKSLQDRNTVPLTWAVQAAHCLAKETLPKSRITRCWPRGQILSAEDFIAHRLLFKFLGLISRVWKLSWSSPFVLKKTKKKSKPTTWSQRSHCLEPTRATRVFSDGSDRPPPLACLTIPSKKLSQNNKVHEQNGIGTCDQNRMWKWNMGIAW